MSGSNLQFEVYNVEDTDDQFDSGFNEVSPGQPKAVPFVVINEFEDDEDGICYEFEIQSEAVTMLQKMTDKKV